MVEIEKILTSSLKVINYTVTWTHPSKTESHRFQIWFFYQNLQQYFKKDKKLYPIYTMIYDNGLKSVPDLTNAFPLYCIQNLNSKPRHKTKPTPIYSEYFFLFLLTLPVPCISESCIEIKLKLYFYFHSSLWCLKRFYEGL